jgi:hypothetical protein
LQHNAKLKCNMNRFANPRPGVTIVVLLAAAIFWSASESQAVTSTIYRLNQHSTYQEGCFPPCLCAISQPTEVRGTFVLMPQTASGSFATYRVSEVNWMFQFGGQQVQVTGSGTYEAGGSPRQQRLQLELSVDGQPAVLFDSGLVPAKAAFPNIGVTISINGERCFDKVFALNVAPAPTAAIHPYQLVSGSSFQHGCFPPCKCALGPRQPLGGRFGLVDLPPTPLFREFSMVNINWLAAPPPAAVTVSGTGFYRIGGEVAVQQELGLELVVGTQPLNHFDSGLMPAKAIFPVINATISINGGRCVDTVMVLKAAPL